MLSSMFTRRTGLLLAATLTLWGCNDSGSGTPGGANGLQVPPQEVLVEVVTPRHLVLKTTLPGRVQALRTAEVRARVEGIIQERRFTEGTEVEAGQLLFQIDPSTLQADYDAAKAHLARAEADLTQATLKQKRFANLLKRKAVSQQDYDEAFAIAKQAEADVAAAKADLARARIDLEYASVRAPITGRIGRALVTEGALVGKSEATHLATVEQLDPIYVNFTQSSNELLRLRRGGDGEDLAVADPKVTLLLEDGSEYKHPGKLLFSEMAVDPGTGEILLRAELPNPDRMLLPGMFVRVSLDQAEYKQALTVSQQALIRSAQGDMVMSVLPDGKVVPLPVKTDRAQGDRWIIKSGLQGGEQIIIEGLQKARPGATVKALVAEPTVEAP
ncbi:efflux RND transporter periplasmic adaptor subunit [Ketobacter sp.]|jgi:membrane fusion protein, multidrug efflux system|uniref:efflux RND transporter periplasmic adaptor subunit n=2 Tax=unclassified Ketobacter TaxID=2639109 RepID=UPI0025C2FDBB|nr:efflux RND transporter periplasmic adaptor subunit [Ketobacter sp.]MEC8810109.1 efflux RND transporter periplasmic adaptor subunit [Pseudomonadota bacterium]